MAPRCCCSRCCGHCRLAGLTRSPNFALAVITTALFVDFLLLLSMVPILPVYGAALGLTPTETGLIFSIKPVAGILAAPILGAVSDRVGRKLPMVLGLLASAGFTILFAFSTTYWQLLLARLLQGVASSTNTAAFAFLADVFPDSKVRGSKIAVAVMGISMGVMLGPLYGGWLYAAGGVRLPFLIGAGLLAVDGIGRALVRDPPKKAPADVAPPAAVAASGEATAPAVGTTVAADDGVVACETAVAIAESDTRPSALVVLSELRKPTGVGAGDDGSDEATAFAPPQSPSAAADATEAAAPAAAPAAVVAPPPAPPRTASFLEMARHRKVATLTVALLAGNAGIALVEVVLPLYLDAELGMNAGQIGALYAGGNALYVLVSRPAAALGSRIGRWKLVAAGCAAMGIAMPLLPVVPSLYWIVPWWLVCSGIGMSLIDVSVNPELADVVDAAFPGSYGRVYAIAQVGVAVGFIIGPLIGTAMRQYVNFYGAFAILGVAVAAYAPVVVWGFTGTGSAKPPSAKPVAPTEAAAVTAPVATATPPDSGSTPAAAAVHITTA